MGLSLRPTMCGSEIQYEIVKELKAQTTEKMVAVRMVAIEVDPHLETVKLVLKNIGDPKDRWNLKDDIEGGAIAEININYVELDEEAT